jgi:hypothetical protein
MHNAVRRYVMDRAWRWRERTLPLERAAIEAHDRGMPITAAARARLHDPHMRAYAHDLLLQRIERTRPRDFATGEAVRTFVLDATAADEPRIRAHDAKTASAIAAERAAVRDHVASLTTAAVHAVGHVPSRFVLPEPQWARVWRRLAEVWDARPGNHYWYPLLNACPPGVVAFQADWFDVELGARAVQELLRRHGVSRVWAMNEAQEFANYELSPLLCPFDRLAGEGYWTSPELDWLVYASHESSVTVAGRWLAEAVQRVWPAWRDRLYEHYDHTPPSVDARWQARHEKAAIWLGQAL